MYTLVMGKKLDNLSNRFGNTVRIPTRLGYTAMNTVTDTVDTLVALPKDALDVVQYTSHEVKNILSSAWTTGKRYQRVGNIILSPFVAMGAAVEGAVKTVVTPGVNGVVNAWNTGKNTVKNTWRSTFGRIFSKKPVSDFSYDKLKTANVIKKDKNWFSRWWFGRKTFSKNGGKRLADEDGKVAPVIVPVKTPEKDSKIDGKKDIIEKKESLKGKMEKLDKDTKSKLKETLGGKDEKTSEKASEKVPEKKGENTEKADIKEKKVVEKTDEKTDSPKKEKTVEKTDEKVEGKSTGKTEGKHENSENIDKKADEKAGEKPEEKIEEKIEENGDEKIDEKKNESLDTENKNKGIDEARKLLENSDCGQKMLDGLCKKYKDFGIVFDKSTSRGKFKDHTITIGTKMPSNTAGLAPLNRETKDSEYQKRHLLLHELSHGAIIFHKDEIPEIQKGLDIIEKYIDKDSDGKTLSLLSYKNEHYKTNKDKAKEDFVEMLALAMNGKGTACKKYMELLSDDEHKEFREKNGLATITKDDAEALENACKAVVKFYKGKKD